MSNPSEDAGQDHWEEATFTWTITPSAIPPSADMPPVESTWTTQVSVMYSSSSHAVEAPPPSPDIIVGDKNTSADEQGKADDSESADDDDRAEGTKPT